MLLLLHEMIERNSDLRAFQMRAIEKCGEFSTIPTFAKTNGLRKIGDKYMVADMAERIFNEAHPLPKRLG